MTTKPKSQQRISHSQQQQQLQQQNNQNKIYFLNAFVTVPIPPKLLLGVQVLQVAANGSTTAVLLRVSNDKFTITLEPVLNKKSSASFLFQRGNAQEARAIDVGEMDRIQRGQSTMEFEKAKKAMVRTSSITTATTTNSASGGKIGTPTSANDLASVTSITPVSGKKLNSASCDAAAVYPTFFMNTSDSNHTNDITDSLNLDPNRSFSIIFRGAHTVDCMASSRSERDEVCDALDRILVAYQRGKTRVASDVQLLRYVWQQIHNGNGSANDNANNNSGTGSSTSNQHTANAATVRRILQEINVGAYTTQRQVQAMYDKFGKVIGLDRASRRAGLTFEQTATFLHKLKRDSWMAKPVTVLWNQLFGEVMNNGKVRMTVSDRTFLERFLHSTQGEVQASLLDVRKLFRRLHDMEIAHHTSDGAGAGGAGSSVGGDSWNRINKDQFEAYLYLDENDAFDPAKEKYDRADMDQPLSEYWINASHNTYLIGDQYKSQSSVEMYSNALYRGCRCLELDIWDGGKDNGITPIPVVWHGHTMTTKIRFADIIQTIKVFLNFHPDTFPIILSFENHCSIPFQQVIAQTLERILGASLYIPTEVSLYGSLPSPSQLRGMVVIKGRRPDGTEADAYDTDDESDDEDGRGTTSSQGILSVDEIENRNKVQQYGVAPELARLTLFHGTKCNTFEQSKKSPTWHMHSFSENRVRSRCRHKESFSWIVYNQTHMSRTYPAGSRVDSSNYNPLLAWSNGCQMVALNFQTQDAFLRLNDGRFRENGNCGYVLKPPALMLKGDFDPVSNPVRLSIRILSGSCLPKPRGQRTGDCIDPYVKVSVFDVKNEEKETITSFLTSPVPANGFFPIWGQEKFTFVVDNWAVAMVQLTVHDKTKDEFIASSSIPVSCLRKGIRSVKLYDATNTRSGAFDFASLLVNIKLGQVVAEI